MKTVRFGTFETNSSSCHSVTVFKDAQDWKDFKEKKVYLRRDMFDMQEHEERLNVIDSSNKREYIRSLDELYEDVKDHIENDAGPLRRSNYHNYNEGIAELEMETYKYLINYFSRELFDKILFEPGSVEVCKLNKPVEVCYDYSGSGKVYTYDALTVNDFYDYIFGGVHFDEIPSFYIYGMCDWDESAAVEEYTKKGTNEEMVVVTRDEEC